METYFQLTCEDWLEWYVDSDFGLKYEYRVRHRGADRSVFSVFYLVLFPGLELFHKLS